MCKKAFTSKCVRDVPIRATILDDDVTITIRHGRKIFSKLNFKLFDYLECYNINKYNCFNINYNKKVFIKNILIDKIRLEGTPYEDRIIDSIINSINKAISI